MIKNLPELSVMQPWVVPINETETKGKASWVSESVTIPVILVWAVASKEILFSNIRVRITWKYVFKGIGYWVVKQNRIQLYIFKQKTRLDVYIKILDLVCFVSIASIFDKFQCLLQFVFQAYKIHSAW